MRNSLMSLPRGPARLLSLVLLGLVVYAAGVGVRHEVLNAQYRQHGYDLPFTLESALYFRRVKMLHDRGGHLDSHDPMIFYPEGVTVRETYTFGAERAQAWWMHRLPDSLTPEQKLRWIDVLWFCLGIPMLGVWVWARSRSVWGGTVGALFYAVALSAVIRSTGQELSRENAALPLLIGFFMASALAETARTQRAGTGWTLAAAGFMGLALWSWDLIQFPLILWGLAESARYVVRPDTRSPVQRRVLVLTCLVVLFVGIYNPYYRAHGFPLSPVSGLMAGLLLSCLVPVSLQRRHGVKDSEAAVPPGRTGVPASSGGTAAPPSAESHTHLAVHGPSGGTAAPPSAGFAAFGRSRWSRAAVCLLPILLFALVALLTRYGESYSHFGDLLIAKLAHGNVKPADPELLTFAQRVMWVPALHSATFALTRELFPAMFPLLIATGLLAAFQARHASFPFPASVGWYVAVSAGAFILFARFHVFVALFGSAWLGLAAGMADHRSWLRWVTGLFMIAGVGAEALQTLDRPERWGRSNLYVEETRELTAWLQAQVAPYPVMANMGISGSIAAYGKCAIALHPKFEQPQVRERYRMYGELLFGDSEEAFRNFMDELGIRHYVYAKGEFAPVSEIYQMRYFVDRLDAGEDSVAWRFEFAPERLDYFYPLWSNRKYAVFAMRTREDERNAMQRLADAREALAAGRLTEAREAAFRAWELNPRLTNAVEVLGTIQALEQAGFPDRSGDAP